MFKIKKFGFIVVLPPAFFVTSRNPDIQTYFSLRGRCSSFPTVSQLTFLNKNEFLTSFYFLRPFKTNEKSEIAAHNKSPKTQDDNINKLKTLMRNEKSLFFTPVSEGDVLDVIKALDVNKSVGYEGISAFYYNYLNCFNHY